MIAERLIDSIASRLCLLADHPKFHRARNDLLAGARSFPVGNYVIVYIIDGEDLQILRIIHGRRDGAGAHDRDVQIHDSDCYADPNAGVGFFAAWMPHGHSIAIPGPEAGHRFVIHPTHSRLKRVTPSSHSKPDYGQRARRVETAHT